LDDDIKDKIRKALRTQGMPDNEELVEKLSDTIKGHDLRRMEFAEKLNPVWKKYGVEGERALLEYECTELEQVANSCQGAELAMHHHAARKHIHDIGFKLAILEEEGKIDEAESKFMFRDIIRRDNFTMGALVHFNETCICMQKRFFEKKKR